MINILFTWNKRVPVVSRLADNPAPKSLLRVCFLGPLLAVCVSSWFLEKQILRCRFAFRGFLGLCFQKHVKQEEGSRTAQREDVIATEDLGALIRGSEAARSYWDVSNRGNGSQNYTPTLTTECGLLLKEAAILGKTVSFGWGQLSG